MFNKQKLLNNKIYATFLGIKTIVDVKKQYLINFGAVKFHNVGQKIIELYIVGLQAINNKIFIFF